MSNETHILQRMLDRERRARKEAEMLLEEKARALYETNLEVLRINASLESEVQERTSELTRAIREANAAKEAEKEFLSKMSHEIRTPMNAIIGMTHLMFDTAMTEEQRDYMNSVHYSADLLRGLITDVLQMSKIEAGAMEYRGRNFQLRELLQAVQRTFQFNLKSKPVDIILDYDDRIPVQLNGDDVILNQILMNLVGNAAKFTKEGFIEIAVARLRTVEAEQFVEFSVRDTGIGIAKDRLSDIFKTFKQASDDVELNFGGSGLGLAITRELVELSGGTIEVQSEIGEGTCFVFRLPFRDAEVEAANDADQPERVSETQFAHDRKILIVEDNPLNQRYLGNLLQKWGVTFDLANNGVEGVEKASRYNYPLVLMDIQMPEMNGYEATIQLRHMNSYKETPIIGLSAFAFDSDIKESLDSGMNAHISKPFTPRQLREKLEEYLPSSVRKTHLAHAGFQFNPQLDTEQLNSFYEGDLEYARDMFRIFLKNLPAYAMELKDLLSTDKMEGVGNLLHKIKPTFPMVGLGVWHGDVERLEHAIRKGTMSMEEVKREVGEVVSKVRGALPMLQNELKRIEEYITQNE